MIKPLKKQLLLGLSLFLPITAHSATFSIIQITDSQFYAERHPEILEAQIGWIIANEVAENIIYVAQTGDLKDDSACDNKIVGVGTGMNRTEWQIVDQAFSGLDVAGIPYGVVPGNHDFDPVSGSCPDYVNQRPLTLYNNDGSTDPSFTGFPPSRFAGDPFYGGTRDPANLSNEDNYTLFDSDGVMFISINLAYKPAPDAGVVDPELDWADMLLKANPDRLGIITSHYLMDTNPGNQLGDYGDEVYQALADNPNLFMMLAGHWWGEAWSSETGGRPVGAGPVQVMMANYQGHEFPDDGDAGTLPDTPNPASIDFGNLTAFRMGNGATDAGYMRIMRFDTDTGDVDIETFIPPVVAGGKNRTGTPPGTPIVSTHTATSGADMGEFTASNLDFTYFGYAPTEIVSCGADTVGGVGDATAGGDLLFRGFYHPSYPGSTLDTVELFISSRAAGNFQITLEARQGNYDGTVLSSATQTEALSGNDEDNVSYVFDFENFAVTPNSTIAFTLVQDSGPTDEVFFAVDADQFPLGGGPGDCDMIQTEGTSASLDTLRRNGLWIRITGIGGP